MCWQTSISFPTGGQREIARIVQGVSLYGSGVDASGYPIWLNKAAFDSATPYAAQRYGNLGYNAIYGPHQVTLDMSVIRRITLYKEHSLNLRGEFFNVLNHANLNNPTITLTHANFGKILTRSGPRNIQLGAEYRFYSYELRLPEGVPPPGVSWAQ